MSRYNSGPLIDLVMAAQGVRDARDITPARLNPQSQKRLTQFLRGLQVTAIVPPRKDKPIRYRPIKGIVLKGADHYRFTLEQTGEEMTVTVSLLTFCVLFFLETRAIQEYFRKAHRYVMKLGGVICVDLGGGIVYPLEVLEVRTRYLRTVRGLPIK